MYGIFDNPVRIIRFANFLGCGGRVKQEIGKFFITDQENGIKKYYYNIGFIKKIYRRLQKAMQEYDKEHFTFFTNEDERAKKAQSERQEFLESVKVNQKALGEQASSIKKEETEVKKGKDGQMEVGG